MTDATKFERDPKPATLEVVTEWRGYDGMVTVEFFPTNDDDIHLRITNDAGTLSLNVADLETLVENLNRYKVALHAIRGTQP